jgi:hypothetical protein
MYLNDADKARIVRSLKFHADDCIKLSNDIFARHGVSQVANDELAKEAKDSRDLADLIETSDYVDVTNK